MCKTLLVMTLTALSLIAVNAQEATANLLKNGNFTTFNSKGIPVGWRIYPRDQKFSEDKSQKPEGSTASACVEIVKEGKWLGSIYQKVSNVTPNSTYLISGLLKSTAPRVGIIQIKLLKNGKELKRINTNTSSADWVKVSKEFSSADADTINVLCRYRQDAKYVGDKAWFANVKLEKKAE